MHLNYYKSVLFCERCVISNMYDTKQIKSKWKENMNWMITNWSAFDRLSPSTYTPLYYECIFDIAHICTISHTIWVSHSGVQLTDCFCLKDTNPCLVYCNVSMALCLLLLYPWAAIVQLYCVVYHSLPYWCVIWGIMSSNG